MKTVLLDCNIYDQLEADETTRKRLASLVLQGKVRVIATPKVIDELRASPFEGVPDWFPIDTEPEAVFVLDHAYLDMARLGSGNVYERHRGDSNNIADAIIADSSVDLADIAVSEDRRFVRRLKEASAKCRAMDYGGFVAWLRSECPHL